MNKLLLLIIDFLLFFSVARSQNLPAVLLDNPGKPNGKVSLSDIGTAFQYISLETSPGCLIGKIHQLEFDGEHIVVADAERILLFDKTGRFIRQIGSSGKGPGQYVKISDIALNPVTGILAVVPIYESQIILYDLQNHHLATVKVSPKPDHITWSDEGHLIGAFNDRIMASAQNNQAMLIIYDKDLRAVKRINSRLQHEKAGQALIMLPTECLHSDRGQTWFKWPRNDTLFAVEELRLKPLAVFDFQRVAMLFENYTVENLMKQALGGEYLYLKDVIIDKNRLFFQYKLNKVEYYGIYNQYDKKLHLIGEAVKPEKITDSIDQGPGFWPREKVNDQLIDWFDPVDIKDLGKWTKKTGVSLKVDDNPVIRFLKTK